MWVYRSCDFKAGYHIYIGQSGGHWPMAKKRHWHHSTKNERLQSEDFHFWVFQPKIIPGNEQCEGCPNCLSSRCHHLGSSCTSFSSMQLGAGASSWKHLAILGVSTKLPWKGSSEIQLQWTQKGRWFPRTRGNKMEIGPRRESRFRQLEPIKNKKGQEEKSEIKLEK
jgi:hypothetical protein